MSTQSTIVANLIAFGFSNPAAEAIYNKYAEAAGLPIDNTIAEIANSESIITNLLISLNGYGKELYYVQAALAFQFGDDLIVNMAINPVTGQPYLNNIYAVIDPTKQIIAQAAFSVVETNNAEQLILKVATTDINGNLTNLSAAQLTAFSNYFLTFELPGLPVDIISIPGNVLSFNAIATVISSYDLPTIQANLAAALISFQDTFEFNGVIYMGQLQDYLKANVPGLKDFYTSATTIDGVPFAGFIALPSGYFNYIANIVNNITYNSVTS